MAEVATTDNFLVVCMKDFQVSFLIDGKWYHEQYSEGDIAILAAGEVFPGTRIDREVP